MYLHAELVATDTVAAGCIRSGECCQKSTFLQSKVPWERPDRPTLTPCVRTADA